jgi:hypothetical protein
MKYLSYLYIVLFLFLFSCRLTAQDDNNYSLGFGIGQSSVSQKVSLLNQREDRNLMELFFIKKRDSIRSSIKLVLPMIKA